MGPGPSSDFPDGDFPAADFPDGDFPSGDFPSGESGGGDFDLFGGDFPTLPDLPAADATPPPAAPLAATAEEGPDEFRVNCPICGSITYARRDQVGKQVKCHDCFTKITVPAPPKPKSVYRPDLEKAEVFDFSDAGEEAPQYELPYRKRAEEYLREAEEADSEEEDDYENPDVRNWAIGVFKIFLDPQVPIHWLLLSILGTAVGAASVILAFVGVIPTALLNLLFWSFVFSCGFSIMESVSNNARSVKSWPYMDPTEWFNELAVVGTAAAICIGPPAIVGGLVFGLHPITVMITMFSLFLMFPYVLISILDSDSVFTPFSADVTKSITRCQDQWGVLYLTSGVLFFGMFFFYIVCFMMPPLMAVVMVYFATIAALFVYFSMIGRLAYAIGHTVNAPPPDKA